MTPVVTTIIVAAWIIFFSGVLIGWKMGRADLREKLKPYVCFSNLPGHGKHTPLKGKCVQCGAYVP